MGCAVSSPSVVYDLEEQHAAVMKSVEQDRLRALGAYHVISKHAVGQFAPGPSRLSYVNSPSSVRRFDGCRKIELPLGSLPVQTLPTYDNALHGTITPAPLNSSSISLLLYHSLALSATKKTAITQWHLRCTPSSGNLHPSEAYLLVDSETRRVLLEGRRQKQLSKPSGKATKSTHVLHYRSDGHLLEERGELDHPLAPHKVETQAPDAMLIVLTAVHWREAWKYGVRAWRYSILDVGHAVAALALAAAALGWRCDVLAHEGLLADLSVSEALVGLRAKEAGWTHLHPQEREDGVVVLSVRIPGAGCSSSSSASTLEHLRALGRASSTWHGKPSVLSPAGGHVEYTAMTRVSLATSVMAETAIKAAERMSDKLSPAPSLGAEAARLAHASVSDFQRLAAARGGECVSSVIRGRRSAHKFDPNSAPLSLDAFYDLVGATLSRSADGRSANGAIWAASTWPASLHLLIIAHHVEGIPSALYLLDRGEVAGGESFAALRERMHSAFDWSARPPHCPPALHGRLHGPLHVGDLRSVGGQLACDQGELAADGQLTMSMLGDLSACLGSADDTWLYRQLHIEGGMLGHALYLEAEAQGVRGSGLGCFFDDEVHKLIGLPDARFQALYHFAVGVPLVDDRLQPDADPYEHLVAHGR